MATGRPGAHVPDLDEIRKCVHCGICLPQCPTYRVLGEEMDSPRGRIYLMRAAAEGRLGLTETFRRHIDLCLGCRACETACPSGVRFGSLLEATRTQLRESGPPAKQPLLEAFALWVFPKPARLGTALAAFKLYKRSGLRALVRASGVLTRFPALAAMDALLDDVPAAAPLPEVVAAPGRAVGRVGLLTGCVQHHLYPHVNRDTARLLSLAGFEVVIPRGQGCCGALELHAGRPDAHAARARALAAAFPADLDFIVTNAAGCGAAMKEYGHHIPELAPFAARVRDATEILAGADLRLGPLDLTVTYHDACHLAHGQRVRQEPRQLLGQIPGLRLIELGDSELCCGSAGIYNLLEPDMARRLLDAKLTRIAESGARVVAAANPGCLLQIAWGCRERGLDVTIVHPVELLARAADAHPD
ncbi:MAG TPA: heterodisulfide reductase-related iron-sulfur binding cluster [Methylomirabilota bacterium]|nr:heterodisulfide reductase-related iron-sulfur binding cluster [Methylomirabilota bacterium]